MRIGEFIIITTGRFVNRCGLGSLLL